MDDSLPLRDIHLPPEPGWWPPAEPWFWLLAGLLLVLVLVWAWRRWITPQIRKARTRKRRDQLWQREVNALANPALRLQSAIALLRRIAMADQPASARLQGQDWLQFLRTQSSDPADRGWIDQLDHLPFQPAPSEQQVQPLVDAMRARALRGFR